MLAELLPRPRRATDGPAAGTVFAVDRDDRGPAGLGAAVVGRAPGARPGRGRQRTAGAGDRAVGERARRRELGPRGGAGQIAVVRGPAARIGDVLGRPPARRTHRFPPATLQALVEPEDPTQRTALFAGLTELADEDPLIELRLDETAGEAAVSLHGEVQKEVIAALLEERYGVRARFSDTSVVCLERVVGTGQAVDRIKAADNPYLAGIGLRVEAAPVGHGVEFSPGIERGNLPPAFIAATEEGVRAALRQGCTAGRSPTAW